MYPNHSMPNPKALDHIRTSHGKADDYTGKGSKKKHTEFKSISCFFFFLKIPEDKVYI